MLDSLKPVVHSEPVEVSPNEVGYNASAIERLDVHLQSLVLEKKLQCASYLIAKNDKILACKSIGELTHHEESPDLMPGSIRSIASITKLFPPLGSCNWLKQESYL